MVIDDYQLPTPMTDSMRILNSNDRIIEKQGIFVCSFLFSGMFYIETGESEKVSMSAKQSRKQEAVMRLLKAPSS